MNFPHTLATFGTALIGVRGIMRQERGNVLGEGVDRARG